MHVVATAGHVDHGKSTLVRALTGMEPDRFAEERRRGLTIDLGYAWTTLTSGHQVAFVDVPGHQRFIANMLAGLGPAPAVLFVVAADEGWSRQSDEHLAIVNALRIRHGVLAITRSDRADPEVVLTDAQERLRGSSLDGIDAVAVSGVSGLGLDALRAALARTLDRLPPPESAGPVRFWIDRSFTVRGAGTVVTGTLSSGKITKSDVLTLSDALVTVRDLRVLGSVTPSVGPVARVALNLRGIAAHTVQRGDVLLTPDTFLPTSRIDVRLEVRTRLPRELMLHAGTAAVPVRVRPFNPDMARLTLARALPLRAGDRAVLRDPGLQTVTAGVLVLDADPPELVRRGSARGRATELTSATVPPDPVREIARRNAVPRRHLERLGIDTAHLPDTAGWLIAPERRATWLTRLPEVVSEWERAHPIDLGMSRSALRRALDVPDDAVLDALLAEAGLSLTFGDGAHRTLGPAEAGLAVLLQRLADNPFDSPERAELERLGLGRRELAAAVRTGRLILVADGVVLSSEATQRATTLLSGLEQPFTVSTARQALGTTRRVAVPLLEYLDHEGVTERVDLATRRIRQCY